MHTWCPMSDKNFWNCDLDGDDSWLWWLTAIGDHHTRGGGQPAIRGITPRSAVAPSSQRDADQGAARVSTSAFRSFWGQSQWHKLDWLLQSNLQKLWTRYYSTQCRVKARKASRREIKYFWERKVYPVSPASKKFQDFYWSTVRTRRVQVDQSCLNQDWPTHFQNMTWTEYLWNKSCLP